MANRRSLRHRFEHSIDEARREDFDLLRRHCDSQRAARHPDSLALTTSEQIGQVRHSGCRDGAGHLVELQLSEGLANFAGRGRLHESVHVRGVLVLEAFGAFRGESVVDLVRLGNQ
jgi:hypothetical protein